MCGVFGYVSDNGKAPDIARLVRMATATEGRGPHAFGFAWIDSRGHLRHYKQEGRITDYLGLLKMASDARMLIGHCRFATMGDPSNNLNNHPHVADGGFIVHNGCVGNLDELIERNMLAPVTDCDSEVFGLLMEQGDGTLVQRMSAAVRATTHDAVVLGLWSRPARLVMIRRGNPLRMGHCKSGWYFGSLDAGLPTNSTNILDDTTRLFTIDKEGQSDAERYTIQAEPCPDDAQDDEEESDRTPKGKGKTYHPSKGARGTTVQRPICGPNSKQGPRSEPVGIPFEILWTGTTVGSPAVPADPRPAPGVGRARKKSRGHRG